MFEKLFSPIKIKDMELKNRIILPAMGTKFSGDGSEVTDKLIDYHVARVKGGSGLNIVEVTSVYTPAAPKRFLSLSEDEYIPGMKRLTDVFVIRHLDVKKNVRSIRQKNQRQYL